MKFVIGAVVSSLAMLLCGAAVFWSQPVRDTGPPWSVRNSFGMHHTLIVNVDAKPSTSRREIGEYIVRKFPTGFDEVLIYVYTRNRVTDRIQWTPQRGFSELVIAK